MFKELFTTANKSKGIAGIAFDSAASKDEEGSSSLDKQLNKQRSKKDLKNKF